MDYREGSIVRYSAYGVERSVRVTEKYSNVKGGKPGFLGNLLLSSEKFENEYAEWDGLNNHPFPVPFVVWGYDAQILEVVR